MFQFPGLAFRLAEYIDFIDMGCPIQKSADQFVFANPRSLSQLITSFFASESQGILHTPLITFSYFLITLYSLSFSQHVKELLQVTFSGRVLNGLPAKQVHRCTFYFAVLVFINQMFVEYRLAFCLSCFFVENIGVEPMTSCLQSRRSSQLS